MDDFHDKQKSYLRKINNSFTNFKKEGAVKMNRGSCKVRIESIDSYWKKLLNAHEQLLESEYLDSTHEYFSSNFFDYAEEIYLQRKGEFEEFLINLVSAPVTGERDNNHSNVNYIDQSIRLPVPELPKFSGNFRDWETFRDLIKSMIIDRADISNVAKLQYLKSCLSGEAADLIRTIPVTGENFDLAWQSLQNYFENTRRLISAHLATLFDLKPMRCESTSELRRIYANTVSPLLALEALQRPVNQWDDLIVFSIERKLDPQTRRSWEIKLEGTTLPPTIEMLKNFLKMRIMSLDNLESSRIGISSQNQLSESSLGFQQQRKCFRSNNKRSKGTFNVKSFHVTGRSGSGGPKCELCGQAHWLAFCETYRAKSVEQRKDFVNSKNICLNCLGNHELKNCISKKRCQKCQKKHHTLLHVESINSELPNDEDKSKLVKSKRLLVSADASTSTAAHLTYHIKSVPNSVLLCTAWVKVKSPHGDEMYARALIDQCSQSSFITESLCQRLKLNKKSISVNVSGLGSRHHLKCRGSTSITIKPRFKSTFSCAIEALVIPKVTSYKPNLHVRYNDWPHLKELVLADPQYLQGGSIDLLLGAAVHARIVEGRVIKGKSNHPIAMETTLGWIISGETNLESSHALSSFTVLHSTVEMSLDDLLQRFWMQEELHVKSILLTPEEQACEDHFLATHSRTPEGRYVVRLPLIPEKLQELGDSYSSAIKMFYHIENKFKSDPGYFAAYCEFMQEYLDLGHMQLITESSVDLDGYVFLPHHGVLKESSTTTRLRTVFNGSCKTNTGLSLNDCLYAGPNLLPEIVFLITSWRKYRYAFTADIKMMFRQIIVHEADRHLQAIVWRFDYLLKIRIFLLCTLTYGLKCSPFIAIRVIKQLALDEAMNFTLGSIVLDQETYMDDVLSGGHDIQTARKKQEEVVNLCRVGGFSLRKWLANTPELLDWLPNELLSVESESLFKNDSVFSVLGLTWQPKEDYFKFKVKINSHIDLWSKRLVLSEASKLFDPLGWIAPIVITAKIFLQKLWILKLSWDEPLPQLEAEHWQKFYNELPRISCIKIPRWLGYSTSLNVIQLHGFADASKLAYGAVLYLRTCNNYLQSEFQVKLIQAKTKVAPLKTLSVPRLELSASHLLAKLTNQHLHRFESDSLEIHLWTDSQDVLYWLQDHPSRWPTFIANRCSDIHSLVPNAKWHHVRTKNNPADLVSRGCLPSALSNQVLWWSGPDWLSKDEEYWPKPYSNQMIKENPALHTVSLTSSVSLKSEDFISFKKFSKLKTLVHVMAYVIRFLLAKKLNHPIFSLSWFRIEVGYLEIILHSKEINRARLLLVYIVQHQSFGKEISILQKNDVLPRKSVLVKLSPFIDQKLLRVGGRIKHSLLSDDEKHPLILPSDHLLTTLIIEDCHKRTLHGGVQLTLTTLRSQYWIIKGRQRVKSIIHNCITCRRFRANPAYQIMGDLPRFRVTPSRPFSKSGVDYAGPISIRTSPGRGYSSYKGFICIFICLSTRAVHLEAVSNYSTEAFIAAFRRFVSRRGHCSMLLSDKGTNFVGADKELKRMFEKSSIYTRTIVGTLASNGTEWRFNPPSAPHFGGIWEAAVKSTKHHIRRVIGETKLTFEELSTLLCQVEACLNSRPLVPLSDDPNDIQALTPAHFLINTASYLIPEPDLVEEKIPVLKRWKLVQQMLHHYWQRWSREYLQSLQQRNKWTEPTADFRIGDLVIIRGENSPPARWPLARIVTTHPGDDGHVRVVTVRTAESLLRRPITKLLLLRQSEDRS